MATSEDALRDEILAYVKEWWLEELADLRIPPERDQAIEAYFENIESESCAIDSAALCGDFGDLFCPLPNDKVWNAYMEIGERDALLDACPWEGHLGLLLGPDGQAWVKVGPVEDIPELEEQ